MARDVITIVVLFVCVQTVRSNHIKGSVSTECFKMIPDIDTGIGCRRVCVRIALRFYRYRRQCEQLIVAVIDVLCRVTLRFSAPSVAMIFGKRSRIFSISVPSNSCARSALASYTINRIAGVSWWYFGHTGLLLSPAAFVTQVGVPPGLSLPDGTVFKCSLIPTCRLLLKQFKTFWTDAKVPVDSFLALD